MSTEFAIQILKLTDSIKGHYSLSNQLERSGTSIGANIREAKYAHSRPDFIAKLHIALKECYETEYWIEIAQKASIMLFFFYLSRRLGTSSRVSVYFSCGLMIYNTACW